MLAFVSKKVILYRVLSFLLLLLPVSLQAGLPVRDMGVFAVYVGMPELRSASILADGQQVLALNTTLNSHFILEMDEADALEIDGESYVGDFIWRRGIAGWEWELALPYISYQKGFMDDFLIDWHESLNLPGGNRHTVANDRLVINYAGSHPQQGFVLRGPVQGPGDLRVTAGKSLQQTPHYQHAVHLGLKLPTGDVNDGLGSGGSDLALSSTHAWQQGDWQEELQAGVLLMEKPRVLAAQRREAAVFASVALTYHLTQSWSAIVQYDMHSPFYKDTDQPALGDGHVLSVGSRWQWYGWALHLALLEDVDVDSVPDVGFQLGIEWRDGK